ncbi:hypothetical protein QE152_g35675 [Popillia japonica]|uniref:Uncharacterized protein n=1 Tax=Popillia japonica TaxID=7064 RepID=A0AAW1IFH0_POPJA
MGSMSSSCTNTSQRSKNDTNISTPSPASCLPVECISSKCTSFLESIPIYKSEKIEEQQCNNLHENTITSTPKKIKVDICNRINTSLDITSIEKSEHDIHRLLNVFHKTKDTMCARQTDYTEIEQPNVSQTDSALDTMYEDISSSDIIDKDNSTECARKNLIQDDASKINQEINIFQPNWLPELNQNTSLSNNTNTDNVRIPQNGTRRSLSMTLRHNPRKVSRSKFEKSLFVYIEEENSEEIGVVETKKRRRRTVNSVYPKNKRRKLFSMESWIAIMSQENEEM